MKKIINNQLNFWSKIIKLDLKYFLSGGFWLGLGEASSMMKAFILSILLANSLTKEVYGQYVFVITIIGICTITTLPGMQNAVIKAISLHKFGTYTKGLFCSMKWSFLGSLGLLGVFIYSKLTGHSQAELIFLISALIFPLYAISRFHRNLFMGMKKFEIVTKIAVGFNILSFLTVGFAILQTKHIFWIILATVLTQVIYHGYFTFFYSKKFLINKNVDIESYEFGKKTSFNMMLAKGALQFDNFIVATLLGFEELAIFTIIILIPNQLKSLINIFTPLILPKSMTQKNYDEKIFHYFKQIMIVSIILILGYTIIAPLVFKIAYPKYYEYVWLSILFNLSFIVVPGILLNLFLVKKNQTKYINKINLISSISMILGSLILIYYFGLIGAIINRLITRFIGFFMNIYYTKKSL